MRIESALFVRRVKVSCNEIFLSPITGPQKKIQTPGEFKGDVWLGLERLTCVPIQTRMVKKNMLTKKEKTWLKVSLFW